MEDYLKFVELVYSNEKASMIKKSVMDFQKFIKEYREEEEEEEEREFFIYEIYCLDDKILDRYVGMTNNYDLRWYNHKKAYENETYKDHNKFLYQFIRKNGGIDNWNVRLLEKKICNRNDARQIEQIYIDKLNTTLNKYKAVK